MFQTFVRRCRSAALCVLIVGAISHQSVAASSPLAIIPAPVSVKRQGGRFTIAPSTRVVAPAKAGGEAAKFIDALAPAMGFRLERVDGAGDSAAADGRIVLSLDPALAGQLGGEGYLLDVTPMQITLRAAEPAGLFYGVQTLRQLLPPEVFSAKPVEGVAWSVPCATIEDRPRFAWRGLLIDPARHFIPVEDVKRFIDAMALHKYNRLQIHLTDDVGWRLEIRKYPELTATGSRMDQTGRRDAAGRFVGGFYTQDDVRELVRYAAERHVTIVPEIEMPSHTGAAIVAYPELGISPSRLADLPPEDRWGKTGGLVAPRPATVAFFQNVLDEVLELFPSKHIHIGGDEANVALWTDDPEMQAQMKRMKLKDVHALHSWFIKQMDGYLAQRGRRLVGWDEILQGGLAPGATVMSWRGTSGGIAAAKAGHDVVMAPMSHTYFDFRQTADEEGFGSNVVTLKNAYAFEPVPAELDAEGAKYVLGGQGQLWGEQIPDRARRDYMTYPRASALAETLWSAASPRDGDAFLARLRHHLKRLDAAGVGYRPLD